MNSTLNEKIARQKLFDVITEEKTLEEVLNIGEELLGTPLAYTNTLIQVHFFSKGYAGDASPSTFSAEQYHLSQFNPDFAGPMDPIHDSTPFILKSSSEARILVSKVYYRGNDMGYLHIPEYRIPLESLSTPMIRQIGQSCAIIDLLRDSIAPVEESSRDENIIFEQLLDKKYKTIADFNFVSKNYSFKKYTQFYILCITLSSDNQKIMEEELSKRKNSYEVGLWYKINPHLIIAMIGLNKKSMSIYDLMADLRKTVMDKDIFIGISDPFTHILALHDHFKNAKSLLIYSKNSHQSKKVHLYDDYKFKSFLKDVNHFIPSANDYISYKIMAILHYDLDNKTDYANTLRAYLSASLSPQLTSEILFIHRNTVIYRVNKMKELFNIDFSDADQVFQLYFSFQLLLTRGWERK